MVIMVSDMLLTRVVGLIEQWQGEQRRAAIYREQQIDRLIAEQKLTNRLLLDLGGSLGVPQPRSGDDDDA